MESKVLGKLGLDDEESGMLEAGKEFDLYHYVKCLEITLMRKKGIKWDFELNFIITYKNNKKRERLEIVQLWALGRRISDLVFMFFTI